MKRTIVRLRFIGKPGGKLVKRAPGNYKQGETVLGPLTWVRDFPKIWELVDPEPVLVIPESSEEDSVFMEGVYTPEEEWLDPLDPETPAQISTEKEYARKMAELASGPPRVIEKVVEKVPEPTVKEMLKKLQEQGYNVQEQVEAPESELEIEPEVENVPDLEMDRDKLKKILDDAGVAYAPKMRTKTLQVLVERVEAQT
jgi:hypothetical protein